jgi:hypothetical protein
VKAIGIGNGIGIGSNVFIDSNFRGKRYRQPTTKWTFQTEEKFASFFEYLFVMLPLEFKV